MQRKNLLVATTLSLLAVASMVTLSRCSESRSQDSLTVNVSETKGLTVEEVEAAGTQALEYAIAIDPNQSVAVVISDREGRILFEAATVSQNTGDSLLTRNAGAGGDADAQAKLIRAESRALVGSFFSSEGEAFSTQTAYFIIQENYPPGTRNEDVGPLFGVEASSFPASDVISLTRFDVRDDDVQARLAAAARNLRNNVDEVTDPAYQAFIHPSVRSGVNNLGTDANNSGGGVVSSINLEIEGQPEEKGGLPLFRQGAHVGGIGVAGASYEDNLDIAIAGQYHNQPSSEILADRVFVDGVRFQYGRTAFRNVQTNVQKRSLATLVRNGLVHVVQGPRSTLQTTKIREVDHKRQVPPVAYIQARQDTLQNALATPEAATANANSAEEAAELFGIFSLAESENRVQIQTRPPNGGPSVKVLGDIKDAFRASPNEAQDINNLDATRDFRQVSSPLTFADVAQIMRNAVDMALSSRAGIRRPLGFNAVVHIAVVDQNGRKLGCFAMDDATVFSYDVAFQKARTCAFFSAQNFAFSARGIGWVAQPHFPPGINETAPGPLFGLQATYNSLGNLLHPAMNGFETFPGGLPLYKNGELVGAIGVSGDGVDQDDQISVGGSIGFEAPANIRSDAQSSSTNVAGLRIGVVKMQAATQAAIDRLQNLGALTAAQQATLTSLMNLKSGIDARVIELNNPGRLTDVRIPWYKFARKPFLFDSQ